MVLFMVGTVDTGLVNLVRRANDVKGAWLFFEGVLGRWFLQIGFTSMPFRDGPSVLIQIMALRVAPEVSLPPWPYPKINRAGASPKSHQSSAIPEAQWPVNPWLGDEYKRQHICIYHGDAERSNAVGAGPPRGRIDRSPQTLHRDRQTHAENRISCPTNHGCIDSRVLPVCRITLLAGGWPIEVLYSRSAGHLSYLSVSPTASEEAPRETKEGPVCFLDPRCKNIKTHGGHQ
ncbi:hypothetical protein LX32DRAFT_109354 [Colletotrichum zoysiae]|uniref:Uncharacterized protein n=1 Tax=Colletotrichum zoysiae TaxID=1216348 RepID=A0AAD9HAE1_9PEZI|nr:hypothetical protein LX32DRAFT_109354 [Colletotrichum zoysiae]